MEANDWNSIGALWLGQMPPVIQAAIVECVRSRGTDAVLDARGLHARLVGGQPLMNFVPFIDDLDLHASMIMGVQCVIRDAMRAEWSVEKYSEMLQRTAGINQTYADKLAAEIFTPDKNVADFAHRFLNWLPDIPFITLDDHAKGILHSIADMLASAMPSLMSQKGEDNLYEFLLLGKKLRELRVRAVLKTSGEAYGGVEALPTKADGTVDREALRDIAGIITPIAIRSLGGLLGGAGGAAMKLLGSGASGPAFGAGSAIPLLGAGDIESGDITARAGRGLAKAIIDVMQACRTPPGRDETGDVTLQQSLSSLADHLENVDPERGGVAKSILQTIAASAPLVGAAAGTFGALAGGAVGLGAGIASLFVHDKGEAQARRAATRQITHPAGGGLGNSGLAQLGVILNELRTHANAEAESNRASADQLRVIRAYVTEGVKNGRSVMQILRQIGVKCRLGAEVEPLQATEQGSPTAQAEDGSDL